MAKKKKHPEHENLERWLVSYADFITLLFATFTALYAIATAELSEVKEVTEAISSGFEQQSLLKGIASVFEGKSTPAKNANPLVEETGRGAGVVGKYDSMTFSPGEVKALEQLAEELDGLLAELNQEIEDADEVMGSKAKGNEGPNNGPGKENANAEGSASDKNVPLRGIELSLQERGIKVSFDSRLLFKPGSAQLLPASERLLDEIARRLNKQLSRHLVHVEGHTDSEPIRSSLYPSNWELSTARASSVVRRLIKLGFLPQYMVAVGYADSRPVATNNTPEGRALNRRIDIILFSQAIAQKIDPNKQARYEKKLHTKPPVKRQHASLSPGKVPTIGQQVNQTFEEATQAPVIAPVADPLLIKTEVSTGQGANETPVR